MTGEVIVGVLAFDGFTKSQALGRLHQCAKQGKGALVVTPNLQFHRVARKDASIFALLRGAEIRLCDSSILRNISKTINKVDLDRVTGTDLTEWLLTTDDFSGFSFAIIGGSAESNSRVNEVLKNRGLNREALPSLTSHFATKPTRGEVSDAFAFIQHHDPTFIFLALGFPKQEILAASIRERFPDKVVICVGAALDYFGGTLTRSPLSWQKLSLEWLWRLGHEPKRLFRRYLLEGVPEFFWLILHESGSRKAKRN